MVRFIVAVICVGLVLSMEAAATEGAAPDNTAFHARVSALMHDANRLRRELERLDHRLAFPSDDHLALYLSLGEDPEVFRPEHVILSFGRGMQIQQYLQAEHLSGLRDGTPFRVLSQSLPKGRHSLQVTISGTDADGELIVESMQQEVTVSNGSVYLEYSLERDADAAMRWQPTLW